MDYRELELYIYDTSFRLVTIVDRYTSLIWTDRYDTCGDFELQLPYSENYKDYFVQDYYCNIYQYSDHWAIIEKIETRTDEDQITTVTVSGRSIESILERRIVYVERGFGDPDNNFYKISMQDALGALLNENIIEPEDKSRAIPNFVYEKSDDPEVLKCKIAEKYKGEDFYKIFTELCQRKHIGFKMTVNDSHQFVLSLYAGKDRTIEQNTSDYVIFSPFYDNMKSADYYTSKEKYRNTMCVFPEEVKAVYWTIFNTKGTPSGLNRREMVQDPQVFRKIGYENTSGDPRDNYVSDTKINEIGRKILDFDYKIEDVFEGDMFPDVMYTYRKDYDLGDKVQFEDSYGNRGRVYIDEVVTSFDDNGLTILPGLKVIDWNEADNSDNESLFDPDNLPNLPESPDIRKYFDPNFMNNRTGKPYTKDEVYDLIDVLYNEFYFLLHKPENTETDNPYYDGYLP